MIPNQVGSLTIKGKVNSKPADSSVFVTTAVMSYNLKGETDEKDEIAYITNHITVPVATGLEANSIFGASFLPSSLLGWLALILIILGLIAVSRTLYMNYAMKGTSIDNADHTSHHIDNLPT